MDETDGAPLHARSFSRSRSDTTRFVLTKPVRLHTFSRFHIDATHIIEGTWWMLSPTRGPKTLGSMVTLSTLTPTTHACSRPTGKVAGTEMDFINSGTPRQYPLSRSHLTYGMYADVRSSDDSQWQRYFWSKIIAKVRAQQPQLVHTGEGYGSWADVIAANANMGGQGYGGFVRNSIYADVCSRRCSLVFVPLLPPLLFFFVFFLSS